MAMTPRDRRTAIAGARANLAGMAADVVNISATGALVRIAHPHPLGTRCPMVLEVGDAPIHLTARVVRCEPASGPLSTSMGQFALAATFVNLSSDAEVRLGQVCKADRGVEDEAPRLYISFSRRCPKCKSRDVVRESRRQYSCGQCGQMFTGIRLGFVRFAR